MKTRPLERYPKWREELILQLRWKGVSGDRIGDIILETDTHLQASGESPDEAFGNAKMYANERARLLSSDIDDKDDDSSLVLIAVASFVGSALYASGAWAIGADTDAIFGLNRWIIFILGAVIIYIGAWRLPFDLIRHPATNRPLLGGSGQVRAVFIGTLVIVGVVLHLFGRLLA